MTFRDFSPGAKVRLSGKFLKNTGQRVGGEGQSRWTVQECSCSLGKDGRFVAVDQKSCTEFTLAELAEAPCIGLRHIANENLTICGQMDHRNDP